MNQQEFYEANAVNGELSDVQMMHMLNLPEGDSTQVQSSVPDAATTPEPEAVVEPVKVEPTPVIQAKDGIHTIPFEKLTEAREGERAARAQAADLLQQLEALRNATPAQAVAAVEAAMPADEVANLFGDYSEEAIAAGVERLVASRTAAIEAKFEAKFDSVLKPLQQKQDESAADEHFSAINAKHPDVEAIVTGQEFAAWVETQPSFARNGYKAAIEQGTAAEVIEALDAFKSATGKLAARPAKVSTAAAAQAAIAKAQSAVPMSLSDIPAGSNAHVDEASAMLDKSDMGMMNAFDGKTPEQINALMNKIL